MTTRAYRLSVIVTRTVTVWRHGLLRGRGERILYVHSPSVPSMIQADELSPSPFPAVLTPRQDRLEERLARAVASNAPRSTVREAVHQLVDHLRLQGIPASRGLEIVMDVASRGSRAATDAARHDRWSPSPFGPFDGLGLVPEWAATRYNRAD